MKSSLARLTAAVIGAALTIGGVDAADTGARQRISIAISGGASKGAYEAGLNWAILKLTREAGAGKAKTPIGGRFRPFELVSSAGASAGGVNTILSGLTWCNRPEAEGGIPDRIDDNVFRDIWLRIDINEILPPRADSELYLPDDAVFSRKDYFDAAADLRKKWHEPAFRTDCRVPLGVTVTRVVPQALTVGNIEVKNQRFYIPFELRVEKDTSVAFFFDPADYPRLADPAMILMPRARNAAPFSISDDLIIEAATTTSAFPTAFGRRRLQYCRLEVGSGAALAESDEEASDTDLVCPPGYVLDEAEFADGGLFDNLPIGLSRTLAELTVRASGDPFPVVYAYIDPDRIRYEAPDPPDRTACASDDPPEACRIMEFSFSSESGLLVGALGTARRYELYRETTSEQWRLNLAQLSHELADALQAQDPGFDCQAMLAFYDAPINCPEAVRRAGNLLVIAYNRINPVIPSPYSYRRLVAAGIASDCEQSVNDPERQQCRIDIERYRDTLADALLDIMRRSRVEDQRLSVSISRSRQSMRDDRSLLVTSRGAPITGTLLGDFGSFLDYKFREYDYYVGVYDAVVTVIKNLCGLRYVREEQWKQHAQCVDALGQDLYAVLGIDEGPGSRYVFARLAEWEFGKDGLLSFSYLPLPPADRDMQIIHDALARALRAGEHSQAEGRSLFITENTFFDYLQAENFVPTKTGTGAKPLLADIIADPQSWPTELTRRITARLVYLERQAADVYAAREPDPDKRESSYTALMGMNAYLMQSATYRYPGFTFSPSTAPEDWWWRYVIPYDLAVDLVEGDILVSWQPTWKISENNLLDVRASLGFAGGLFKSSSNRNRENYLALGLGYIRRTGSATVSSFGITPTWYHKWRRPDIGDQDTAGGDIYVGLLKDRLRVGLGTRDIRDFGDEWFLTIGIMDLPGAAYWLTR